MHYQRIALAIGLYALTVAAHASHDNFGNVSLLTQQEFRGLSEDLTGVFSYKPVTPAAPLGTLGFDIGIALTGTSLAHPRAYQKATGTADDTVYLSKIHVHKGLPFGFDVGAAYSELNGAGVSFVGAEARYALVRGGVMTPAVALRLSYSALRGTDHLDLATRGVDLSVSKGFAMVSPYAGIGTVWTTSKPRHALHLHSERFTLNKYFVGATFNLLLMNLSLEADRTGETSSYSAKFGLRF